MSLPGLHLCFHPDEKDFPSWYEDKRTQGVQHPCFVAVGTHCGKDGKEFYCEAYQFYFETNLGIGLFGVAQKSKALGYHKHDVEGIFVLYDPNTHEPLWVYFKAHGAGQGVWREWDKCEKTPEGALVVYIAFGSHATYPCSGDVDRILFVANDRVSNKGRKISITKDCFIPAKHKEFCKGIVIYDTIQCISNYSVKKSERILLPFKNKIIRKKALGIKFK